MSKKIENFVCRDIDNLFDTELEMNEFMSKVNVLDIQINPVPRDNIDACIVFSVIYEKE